MPSPSASKTYGTVSADEQKEMSGLEFVQGLADGTLPLNTIAKTLGYDITEAESGRVVVTAEPKDIRSCPTEWCKSAGSLQVSGGSGRFCQAATAGSLTKGSSLKGAMVSRVI